MNTTSELSENQRMICAILFEAKSDAAKPAVIGRTSLQKILYLLKQRGVPIEYSFELHHFGPFCQEIMSDVEELVEVGVVSDTTPIDSISNYTLDESYDQHLHSPHLTRDQIADLREVVGVFARLNLKELEGLTTMHFLFRRLNASNDTSPSDKQVIEQFMEVKGARYTATEAETIYESMIRLKMA